MSKPESENQSVPGDPAAELTAHGSITHLPQPTPEEIEQRARELALIGGHRPSAATGSDREQAEKELVDAESANEPADDAGILPGGMGAPPTSTGKQIENHLPDDDDFEAQEVERGVAEADHDTMREAGHTHTKSVG